MKTAMEKKETGLLRHIGYLSFVVVLLYGLTLFAVSCDNDEDPPLPPAVEKVVLAFVYFPIPDAEIKRLPNLGQNRGWEMQ